MKRTLLLLLVAAAAASLVSSEVVDARRLGGGRSFGTQRESVMPSRPATAPAAPANAASGQAAAPAVMPKTAPVAASAPPPSGMSRWLGPLAGIAAGLGLAALLSHFGLSEGLGSLLLLVMALMAGVWLLRRFMSRGAVMAMPRYTGALRDAPGAFNQATPRWQLRDAAPALLPAVADAPQFGMAGKPLPRDFDAAAFVREAKRQYIEVQCMYDNADRAALSGVMTAEMARDIGRDIDNRGAHQPTEIIALDAAVLDVATEGGQHWVSVRFTGQSHEDGEAVAQAIDEVWNLSKPVNGNSGWLLAGISQVA